MKIKSLLFALIVGVASVVTAEVVSVNRPTLVLKGETLARLEKAKFTATRVGSFFTPGVITSTRVRKVKCLYGGEALHVEMQCVDAGLVKCLVLELTDGKDGVNAWVISSTYLPETEAQLGAAFENDNGTMRGKPVIAVESDTQPGYGLRDLKVS